MKDNIVLVILAPVIACWSQMSAGKGGIRNNNRGAYDPQPPVSVNIALVVLAATRVCHATGIRATGFQPLSVPVINP
jgi:hypothetical protein